MKDTTITIRISEAEKNKLQVIALDRDVPMSQLIREAIKNLIQEEKSNGN